LIGGGAARVLADQDADQDAAGGPAALDLNVDVDLDLKLGSAVLPDDDRLASPSEAEKTRLRGTPDSGSEREAPRSTVSVGVSRDRPRASRRAPPPRDLTVPVSPAITRGSKRRRAPEQTTEELSLARSLRAAAEEKARRGRRPRAAAPATDPAARGDRWKRTRGNEPDADLDADFQDRSKTNEKTPAAFGKSIDRVAVLERGGGGSGGGGGGGGNVQFKPLTVAVSPRLSKPKRFFHPPAKSTEALELEKLRTLPAFRARPVPKRVLAGEKGAAEKATAAAERARAAAAVAAARGPGGAFAEPGGRRRRTRSEFCPDCDDDDDAAAATTRRRESKRARLVDPFEGTNASVSVSVSVAPSRTFPNAGGSGGARRVFARSDVDDAYLASIRSPPGRVDGVTAPAPFALRTDRRGLSKRFDLERAEAVRERNAEALRSAKIRARPVPKTSASRRRSALPEPVFKPPTRLEPFQLKGAALRAYEKKKEAERVSEAAAAAASARRFASKPAPPTTHRPSFVAKPSDRALTTPAEDILRAGEARTLERARFDASVARLAAIKEEEALEKNRLERVAADAAEAALRKSLRFKAKPVPDYRRLASLGVGRVPEKTLTRPESPALRTNRRASRWG
jgi:hypothetical protein